LCISFPEIMNF